MALALRWPFFGASRSEPAPRSRPVRTPKANRWTRARVSWLARLKLAGLGLSGLALLSAFSLGLIVAYQALLEARFFGLAKLTLNGQERLDREEVLRLAGLRPGVSLLKLDLKAARLRLLDSPWVAEARVRRVLPDELRIDLTERRPLAVVMAGRPSFVDGEGVVFKTLEPGENIDLPVISGLEAGRLNRPEGRRALAGAVEVLRLLQAGRTPLGPSQISEIHVENSWSLALVPLSPGPIVRLGLEEPGARLEQWARVRSDLQAKGLWPQVAYIDLRFRNQAFVGLKKG